MFNIVRIGDKAVPMLSKASIDNVFFNIFHEDPLRVQVDCAKDSDDPDIPRVFDFYKKMGFVMAKFAEVKESKLMNQFNEETYYEWLDEFEREDLTEALEDIRATYEGQSITKAVAKKKSDEPTDE